MSVRNRKAKYIIMYVNLVDFAIKTVNYHNSMLPNYNLQGEIIRHATKTKNYTFHFHEYT